MSQGSPIRTVGDLIERLSAFDQNAPIRLQQALASVADFVVGVGIIPEMPGTVGIIYMAPPADDAGS